MSIGLITIIISSIAILVLSFFSFMKAGNATFQLYYILSASFFSGMLFIVGVNSGNFSVVIWPCVVMINVVSKTLQLARQLRS